MTRAQAIKAIIETAGCSPEKAEEILLALDGALTLEPVIAEMSGTAYGRSKVQ